MNEIVNIIDRRAGVGRPVRTGKQKQAERGARRERRFIRGRRRIEVITFLSSEEPR